MRCTRCAEPNPPERLECVKCGEPLLDALASTDVGPAPATLRPQPTDLPSGTDVPSVTRMRVPVESSPGSGGTFSIFGMSASATGAVGTTGDRTLTGVFAGRYEILSILGEGGMGRVYKVRDRELDKVIALKTIRGESDPESIQRFKHEMVLARKITHKNVVRLYDLGEAEGCKYFTMEFIEGDSLKTFIRKRGHVAPVAAMEVARQVLGGLQEAHAQGVVHRDLKPQNIMVDGSGTPHLMDFGIARSTDTTGMTATGAVVGTPDYMSPEQVRGLKAGPPSDLFSFGVILYEMLSGDVPYQADTPLSRIMMRLSQKPQSLRETSKEVPKYLEAIVLKCLEVDEALRYQSAGEILADLDRHHVSRSLTLRVTRAAQRSRGPIVALALLVLAALGGWWWSRRSAPAPAAAPDAVQTLAIVPFTNAAGTSELDWMRTGLPEMLVTDLAQSRFVRPVPGDRLLHVLEQAGLGTQTRFDEAALESVSRLAPAETVLSGQFVQAGGKLRLDLALRRGGSGVSTPVKVEASTADVFSMVDQITRSVKQHLDLTADQIKGDADRPVSEVTTKSLEAFRAYQGGLAQLRQDAPQAAIPLLQEATAKDAGFAMAYAKLAEAQREAGDHDEAEASIARAEDLAERSALPLAVRYQIHAAGALQKEDYETAARTYAELAKLYPQDPDVEMGHAQALEKQGKLPEATQAYKRVTQLAPGYGAALLGLGRVQNTSGHSEEAIRSLQEALATKQFDGQTESLGMIHSILGVAYRDTAQFDRAVEHLSQSLELRQKAGNKAGQAVTLFNLASVYQQTGEVPKALDYYGKALALARALGDRRRESNVLFQMGQTYQMTGNLDKALAAYRDSMRIETERQDHTNLGNRLNSIAEVYRLKGQYDDAVVYLEQAKTHLAQSDRKVDRSINLTYMGIVRKAQGLYDPAIEAFLGALAISQEIHEEMGVAAIGHDLADIYTAQGRYADAHNTLERSLEIYTRLKIKHDVAEVKAPLGHLLLELGQTAAAEKALKEAEEAAKEAKAEGIIPEILLGKAELLHRLGKHEEAAATFEQANIKANLSGQKEVAVESRIALGELYLEQGKPENAETLLKRTREEAAQARLKPLEASAAHALCEVLLARGDAAGARRQAQDSIRLAETFSGRPLLYRARACLARSLDKLGKGEEALDAYAKAAESLDWIRGSLLPQHVAGFLAQPDVKGFLRTAMPRLEKAGRAPESLRSAPA